MARYALGGFLAGMIPSGQLRAVFLSNASGAWDNAKKSIEERIKGSFCIPTPRTRLVYDHLGWQNPLSRFTPQTAV